MQPNAFYRSTPLIIIIQPNARRKRKGARPNQDLGARIQGAEGHHPFREGFWWV